MATISDRVLERVLLATEASLTLLTNQIAGKNVRGGQVQRRRKKKPTDKQLAALRKGRRKLAQMRKEGQI